MRASPDLDNLKDSANNKKYGNETYLEDGFWIKILSFCCWRNFSFGDYFRYFESVS